MGRAVFSLQRDEQGNRSQKAKALWAMKAAKDMGEECYDPTRKEDILGSTKKRLELSEEHLKTPSCSLGKGAKVRGESLLRLASGSSFPWQAVRAAMACTCVGTRILQKMWEGVSRLIGGSRHL